MPQLEARARAERTDDVVAGEFRFDVTFANTSGEPARLNTHQASHPALVLDVRDGKGGVVLLAPPSAPDEQDLGAGQVVPPGGEVTIEYAGFLDRDLPPGQYRVRYFGEFEALGGTKDDPLRCEWLDFTVRPPRGVPEGRPIPGLQEQLPPPSAPPPAEGLPGRALNTLLAFFKRFPCVFRCWISTRFSRPGCERVVTGEFDEARSETISNAPPGSEAWNGTYGWRARFHLRADEAQCRATVTIRVRLVGTITAAQPAAWETAIEAAWNNRFKLCGTTCWCCCTDGMAIVSNLEFVASGEHQVVNVGASTTNMGNWGATDTIDISHEFGHMLGALDEYFTVNGTNWGPGRQATGAIMNNPANPPAARHYETVRAAAASILGRAVQTVAQGGPCP